LTSDFPALLKIKIFSVFNAWADFAAPFSPGWFYHNPYDGNGVWWPELPTYPVEPDSLESLRKAETWMGK